MSAALRWTSYGVFSLLWVSGCLWLILHERFPSQTPFGPLPNLWEAPLIHLHGWLAVAGVFVLGWICGGHVLDRWPLYRVRASGPFLAGLAALLVATGYALYYTTDRVHQIASTTHRILGAAGILLAILHWTGNSRRR
jgi:hypothetical protein